MLWNIERVAAEARKHVEAERVREVVESVAVGWVMDAEAAAPSEEAAARVGGVPRLADADAWPRSARGLPLTFLAEVDLGRLAAPGAGWADPRPPRLRSGLLSVFADLGDAPWDTTHAVVLHQTGDPVALPSTPRPAADAEPEGGEDAVLELDERVAPVRPFLTLPESLPSPDGTSPHPAAWKRYQDLAMRIRTGESQAWLEDGMRDGPDPWSLCHVFGHAVSTQEDVRSVASRAHRDVPMAAWSTVLGLHSGWGGLQVLDGGSYHAIVPTDDLPAGRWDRVMFEVSSL